MKKFIKGFTLIEMSFVLLIMGLMLVAAAQAVKQTATTAKANQFGDEATLIINSANAYTAQNFEALIHSTSVAGVANEFKPTIAELKAIGLLPAGVSTTNTVGTGWTISLALMPTGCPVPACDISVLANTDAAVLNTDGSGTPNISLLAQAMARVGGNAGMSTPEVPGNISGKNGLWTVANPLAGNPAGIFGVRGGFGASGYSQFVRNGDSRNISLGGNLSVAGNNTVSGNQTVTGLTKANGGLNTTNLAATGNVTVAGNTTVTGNVTAAFVGFTGYSTAPVVAGAACSPNGKTGVDGNGSLYSCTSGFWVSTSIKPCVHGSYAAIFSGSNPVSIPVECAQIKIVYMVGAGSAGAGVGAYKNASPQIGLKLGGGAGGTSGAAIINQTFQNTAPSGAYTVTVGAGGGTSGNWGGACYFGFSGFDSWFTGNVSSYSNCFGEAGGDTSIVSTSGVSVNIVATGGSEVGNYYGSTGSGAIFPGIAVVAIGATSTYGTPGTSGTYVSGAACNPITITGQTVSGYKDCGDMVSGGNGAAGYGGPGGAGATVTTCPTSLNGPASGGMDATTPTATAYGAGGGGGAFCGYVGPVASKNLQYFRAPTAGANGAVSISW